MTTNQEVIKYISKHGCTTVSNGIRAFVDPLLAVLQRSEMYFDGGLRNGLLEFLKSPPHGIVIDPASRFVVEDVLYSSEVEDMGDGDLKLILAKRLIAENKKTEQGDAPSG